jgi:hypothetical protein
MQAVDNVDLAPQQSAILSSIRSLPTSQDVQVVRLNPSLLVSGNQVTVNFKSQASITVQNNSRDLFANKVSSWSGQALEGVKGSTTMVVDGDDVTASIQAPDGLYRIRPLGNGLHAFIKVDTTKMPAEHPPSFNEKNNNARDLPPFVPKPATDTSTTTISVLVAYTPAVEKKVADIKGLVQLAFAETNQSYKNSNININLIPSPVDPMKVGYTENGSMDAELDAFIGMTQVQQARAQNGSNVAVLLVDDGSYCGLAKQILATKQTAFVVVYYDCATGYYSFGHEIGHLQGARHNPEMDNGSSPFPYGHGYMDLVRKRRTIMSYDCPGGCPRMPEWARPTDWGTADLSNDARALNETANYIAGFR